jgi:transcriptional regulator PpsR
MQLPSASANMAIDSKDRIDFSRLSPVANQVAEVMASIASDLALVVDADGVILNVAEGSAALPTQCSQWVGHRWVDTASTDTRRKIELLLDEARAGSVTQRREVNHPIVDGDDVPIAWTAISLGENGPLVAVGRDLRTVAAIQRRFLDAQHEMELDYWRRRHADSRYRLLFQVASDGVLLVDAATLELIEANDAARRLLTPDPLIGPRRPLAGILPPAASAPVMELLTASRGTGRAGEVSVRFADGGSAWAVSATPFSVNEQQQLLVRLRQQERLQTGEDQSALMRTLVESTPDAVVVTDSSGRILLANPAFVSLLREGSDARLRGQRLTDVVGDTDGSWREAIARTRAHGLCPCTPLTVGHGEIGVAVEVSSSLLTDGDQEHLGFALRIVDPPRAASLSAPPDLWPELATLRAQVGLASLDELVREGAQVVEHGLVRTALRLASGRVAAAAQLLRVEPERLARLLSEMDQPEPGTDGADDDNGASPARPTNMN